KSPSIPKTFQRLSRIFASSFVSHQTKTPIPENRPVIRQQSKPPGRIYEITEDKIQQEIENFEKIKNLDSKNDIEYDLMGKDDA
ncbi:hypothetical protein GcC1_168009, partial [Golovinomyces cichoracearum]